MKLLPYLLALGLLSACRAAENSGALAEYREYFEIADMLGGPSAGTFCSLATPEQMLERDNTRKRLAANPDLLLKVQDGTIRMAVDKENGTNGVSASG